jgi:hypothetical protein
MSGVGKGMNFNILLRNTVEKSNCGERDFTTSSLEVANFTLPILLVCTAGVCCIIWYFYTYLRPISQFFYQQTLQELLSEKQFRDCFIQVKTGRSILLLDRVEAVLENDITQHIRFIRGACKFYLTDNMEAFFQLTRLASLMYRGSILDDDSITKTSHLRHAAKVTKEVKYGINLLITQAIHKSYQYYGTLDDFTFVCRDETHLKLLQSCNFGEKTHNVVRSDNSLLPKTSDKLNWTLESEIGFNAVSHEDTEVDYI